MFKKILACSVSRRVIVIALFSSLCLKDQLGLCSLNCHTRAMFCELASGFCEERKFALSLLTHVGFLRQNGLILSEVYCIWKEVRIKKKIYCNRAKKFHLPEEV